MLKIDTEKTEVNKCSKFIEKQYFFIFVVKGTCKISCFLNKLQKVFLTTLTLFSIAVCCTLKNLQGKSLKFRFAKFKVFKSCRESEIREIQKGLSVSAILQIELQEKHLQLKFSSFKISKVHHFSR